MTRIALPLIVSSFSVILMLVLDVVMVRALTDAHQTGLYAAAAVIGHIPYYLLQSTALAVIPAVAAAVATGTVDATIRRCASDVMVLLSLPTLGTLLVGDRALPLVVGADYHTDELLVAPIAIATAAITLHAAFVAIDAGLDRLPGAVTIGAIGVTIFCASIAWGAHTNGIAGAAMASGVSGMLVATAHGVWLTVRHGRLFDPRVLWAWLLGGALVTPLLFIPTTTAALLAGSVTAGTLWLIGIRRLGLIDLQRNVEPPATTA
jgi:O-antigen/teichoic acid export membrane protein